VAAQLGPPAGYEAWLSQDGQGWGASVAQGEFPNIAASRAQQKIRFAKPADARYLRLRLPNAVQNKTRIIVGAIGVITR
jgi:alpha-L-fucosidase